MQASRRLSRRSLGNVSTEMVLEPGVGLSPACSLRCDGLRRADRDRRRCGHCFCACGLRLRLRLRYCDHCVARRTGCRRRSCDFYSYFCCGYDCGFWTGRRSRSLRMILTFSCFPSPLNSLGAANIGGAGLPARKNCFLMIGWLVVGWRRGLDKVGEAQHPAVHRPEVLDSGSSAAYHWDGRPSGQAQNQRDLRPS